MADSAIILYLVSKRSNVQFLGQRDLNKKNYIKICKNVF